jgi:hypothetical protein
LNLDFYQRNSSLNGHGGPRPNAGRKRKDEALTTSVVKQYTTERDWRELVKTLIRLGKEGEVSAIKILLAYRDGQPAMAIQHSGGLTIGHVQTWDDVEEQCRSMNLDPIYARSEAIALIESAVTEQEDE